MGAEEGVGASKIIVMVLCLIPLTALSIYVLNPQISTEAPEQINDGGRIGYVVPNDESSDTFTHQDGASSSRWCTQFTWHNTFWCVEDDQQSPRLLLIVRSRSAGTWGGKNVPRAVSSRGSQDVNFCRRQTSAPHGPRRRGAHGRGRLVVCSPRLGIRGIGAQRCSTSASRSVTLRC